MEQLTRLRAQQELRQNMVHEKERRRGPREDSRKVEVNNSTEGGNGKESIYNIDVTTESDWWTQCDSTGAEDDLYFCIMENSKSIASDEQERARTTRIDNSKNVATVYKLENVETIVRDGQNRAMVGRTENVQSAVRDTVKIEDHGEWMDVRIKNPDFRWQHQQRNQECIVLVKMRLDSRNTATSL